MMSEKSTYDVVVIGSGLGGLVAAVTLAKEGKRVCVLEKNNQFGGNLQTFSRRKKIFDTGVHYIGGLSEGQNLYRYFSYLGIMDQLSVEPMPIVFDEVRFGRDPQCYPIAQGYTAFVEELASLFPTEKKALQHYVQDLQQTCSAFPLYNLEHGEGYKSEVLHTSVSAYFENLTTNKTLRAALIGNNFLYAGEKENTPFYVHALAVNSYIQSAYRCVSGGSQISKLLVRALRQLGGDAFHREEVTALEVQGGKVRAAKTSLERRLTADIFIANIDPKYALQLVGKTHFREAYYERIQQLPVTTSSFSLHVVLHSRRVRYRANNLYYHDSTTSVWSASNYAPEEWPTMFMLSMTEDPKHPGYADTLTVLTYMHFDEVEPWASTRNTVLRPANRGETYDAFKRKKTNQLLQKVALEIEHIWEAVDNVYASTPLSFRDYIGVHRGNLYGHVKDVSDPVKTFISPKTKLPNFYLTGQGVGMHGILGVTVGAIVTCSEILGQPYLLEKIRQA
ncbi:phytoene desaturase family protein [Sphingobacterium suaedae]|uniref:Phytoene desaturase family protein n=1 Tax=Sphingobacterium suaedae TaxID=1686402 RepID=A0ABW5KP25_9SPHI